MEEEYEGYTNRLNSITRFTSQATIDRLFEEMYFSYADLVGFVLLPYGLDRESTKDIINESFFKLYQNKGKVKDVKYFLLTCAKNLAINEKKRVSKLVSIDDYIDIFESQDTSLDVEVKMTVERILSSLSKEEKQLFDLYILQDLSSKEVAKKLGLNHNTVRTKWNRALQKIKEELNNE